VAVVLGVIGRSGSGFWSVLLWSIVGFVAGSLVAIAVTGRLVAATSEDEAFAGIVGFGPGTAR
jgi:ABC-type transporter Mla maintaining outer membrane lipid asymmetry ATPase subunit MlaF